MAMPRKSTIQKRAAVETAARKLARSGRYRGSTSILVTLLALGFTEAPKVFANLWTRSELDRLCEQAQQARVQPEASLR